MTGSGPGRAGPPRPRRPRDRGQAAVELALALPMVAVLLLALVQVTVVVRDQVAVVHAAREGARAAAVTGATPAHAVAAARAATGLDGAALDVSVTMGASVQVTVRYDAPTDVPLIGRFVGDVRLQATATMRREP